jgi:hypothetical protein
LAPLAPPETLYVVLEVEVFRTGIRVTRVSRGAILSDDLNMLSDFA